MTPINLAQSASSNNEGRSLIIHKCWLLVTRAGAAERHKTTSILCVQLW